MNKSSVRWTIFALLVLVTVAGPGPAPRLLGVKLPRGVGCGGGAGRGVGCAGRGVGCAGRAPVPLPKPLPHEPVPFPGPKPTPIPPLEGPRPFPRPPLPIPPPLPLPGPGAAKEAEMVPGRVGIGSEELFGSVLNRDWNGAARLVGEAKLPADLPPALRAEFKGLGKEVGCLNDLSALGAEINSPWKEPVKIDLFEAHLKRLGESPENAKLLTQLRQYYRCRYYLEGDAQAAAKVLPGVEAPADTEGLLRDMKALSAGGDAPQFPSRDSVLGMVPEPTPISFRPGVNEKLGADLPPLTSAEKEALSNAEKAALVAVMSRMEASAEVHFAHVHVHLYHLTHGLHYVPVGTDRDRDEQEKTAAEVEKALGRNLTPAERVLVRHLKGKKSVEELAAILRETAKP